MGTIGQLRRPRIDSQRMRDRIYDGCATIIPAILKRGSITSGSLSELVNSLMRNDHSAQIQCQSVVKNWLLDHPEIATCDDGYWSLRQTVCLR